MVYFLLGHLVGYMQWRHRNVDMLCKQKEIRKKICAKKNETMYTALCTAIMHKFLGIVGDDNDHNTA